MNKQAKRVIAGAGAALLMAAAAAFGPTTAASAANAADIDTRAASCSSDWEQYMEIPDGPVDEDPSWAGYVYFHDYNEDTGNDQDNFYIDDRNLDGQSSSMEVWNRSNGKNYYKHVYNGNGYCMGVGNISKGSSAAVEVCGWDDGVKVGCRNYVVDE